MVAVTAKFQLLYVLVILELGSRRILQCNVTAHPTLLNANGENPVVQELLRHASLNVTTDVYMQAVGPQKREAQSNLVRLVRRGFDSGAKSS